MQSEIQSIRVAVLNLQPADCRHSLCLWGLDHDIRQSFNSNDRCSDAAMCWTDPYQKQVILDPLILVVDDEPAFCEVVCEILRAAGYRAIKASHVQEAYLRLAEQKPDLILTDVMMPEIDGLTFTRQLKAHPDHALIPVVVVSARTSADDQREALAAGAVRMLPKPFSSAQLESLVHSLLR